MLWLLFQLQNILISNRDLHHARFNVVSLINVSARKCIGFNIKYFISILGTKIEFMVLSF